MRLLPLGVLLPLCLLADDNRTPIPVVVELFTSEGCSSCPPADEALAKLDRNPQVGGARVIALEEHVDYWNQLGWVDLFSAPIYRGRQNDYSRAFHSDNVYTPQMVVGGQVQFVGDDLTRAKREVSRLAVPPGYELRVQPERSAKDPALTDLSVFVKMFAETKPRSADVYLAVTESKLSSYVERGENAGRFLKHAPVVRSFGVIGSIEARRFHEVGIQSTMKLPKDWKRENLRAVVFVQERASKAIVAAEAVDLK